MILKWESAWKAEAERWDSYQEARPPSPSGWAAMADRSEWGVPQEKFVFGDASVMIVLTLYCCSPKVEVEVSIEVWSHVKESGESSACRSHFLPTALN